jgi:hypothetical protein
MTTLSLPTTPTIEERSARYEERFRLLFLAIDQELDVESLVSLGREGLFEYPDEIQVKLDEIQALLPDFSGTDEELKNLPESDETIEDLLSYADDISDLANNYFHESAFLEVAFAGGSQPDHVYFLITCGGPDIRIRVYVDETDPIEVQHADVRYATWGEHQEAPFSKGMAERLVEMACPENSILQLKFKAWGGSKQDWDAASA